MAVVTRSPKGPAGLFPVCQQPRRATMRLLSGPFLAPGFDVAGLPQRSSIGPSPPTGWAYRRGFLARWGAAAPGACGVLNHLQRPVSGFVPRPRGKIGERRDSCPLAASRTDGGELYGGANPEGKRWIGLSQPSIPGILLPDFTPRSAFRLISTGPPRGAVGCRRTQDTWSR